MPCPFVSAMMSFASPVLGQATLSGADQGNLGDGVVIAAVGLLIVFVALVLISLFIATLPHVLVAVGKVWPEVSERHESEQSDGESEDDVAVLAAIGFVLHTELQSQLRMDASSKTSS